MSRSNPTDNLVNPAVRWFEWTGEHGQIRYYDKDAKQNIDVPLPFSFILLDQLGSVRGWHESSQSGIYSNEVRDTRQDALVVKAFKYGTIAEGLYREIKDRTNAAGGRFNTNLYIAFKHGDAFDIGALRLKGAAMSAWIDFAKDHRQAIWKDAVTVTGFTEGKKGRVTFRVPIFGLKPLSDTSNQAAIGLDTHLQIFLKAYLAKNKKEQVDTTPEAPDFELPPTESDFGAALADADDIPF